MNAASSAAVAMVDSERRISVHLLCVDCGYNLRTLAADGRCPECGRDVADTIAAAFARRGDYLTAVMDGTSALSVGLIFLPIILPPICLASIALIGFGLLAITRPDPSMPTGMEGWSWRRTVRGMLFGAPLLIVSTCAGAPWALGLAAVLLLALPISIVLHLRSVARSLAFHDLGRNAEWCAWLAAVVLVGTAALFVDANGLISAAPLIPAKIAMVGVGSLGVGAFALLVALILFLNRMRDALEERIGPH